MPPKIVDRYFVVNTYPGKIGWRQRAREYATLEGAVEAVEWAIEELWDLSGPVADERFDVYVGSKTSLDEILKTRA